MPIKLTFHGAAGDHVTGSAYHLETGRASLLVDCGLFQGGREAEELNPLPASLPVRGLDAVLVTHAHLDHTGRLPLLAKAGYAGPIFCTEPTVETSRLILADSAKVQAQDLARTNRKRERAGDPPLQPLYTAQDVEQVMPLFRAVPYDTSVPVAPGVRGCWVEAGHLLGSASIQLFIEDGDRRLTVVFSGDLGRRNAPLLKDPEGFSQADVVVLESTYGDHDHKAVAETVQEFQDLVKEAVERGSKILVPTFAVGRTQVMLYLLALMFRHQVLPKFPVFVDSPMAIEATRIFARHLNEFDAEFQALQREYPIREDLDSVHMTPTAEDSMKLNDVPGPCLIMAGAGMCNAGRILHHLKQNLWREGTVVLIVGYQAQGSLGRTLVEGARSVSIFGERIAVRARINTLGGFSAHAGQSGLLDWFAPMAKGRPRVLLTHGERKGRAALSQLIAQRHGLTCELPALGQTIVL